MMIILESELPWKPFLIPEEWRTIGYEIMMANYKSLNSALL